MKSNSLSARLPIFGVLTVSTITIFQNCGGFQADTLYAAAKHGTLSASTAFAASNTNIVVVDGKCFIQTPTGANVEEVECPSTPTPTPTPPDATPTPTPTPPVVVDVPTSVNVPYFCARGFSTYGGFNLKSTSEPFKFAILEDEPFAKFDWTVVPADNPNDSQVSNLKPICEWVDSNLRSDLINSKKFTVRDVAKNCPNLKPGTYKLAILPASIKRNYQRDLLLSVRHEDGANYVGGTIQLSDGLRILDRTQIVIKIDSQNLMTHTLTTPSVAHGNVPQILWSTYGDYGCDYSVSPLVVQMKSNQRLQLTSQIDGILFDIMGLRSTPVPHTKKQISWFVPNAEAENYFIVLPNEKGEVNGIEELFGDNTSGPDGLFAENGYEALRKWDGRLENGKYNSYTRDGFITNSDAVFEKLRFWKDANYDGIAQPHELHTLEALGVESIDLEADANYAEVDEHGNRITLKSVVRTTDSNLHVMYDLWFSGQH